MAGPLATELETEMYEYKQKRREMLAAREIGRNLVRFDEQQVVTLAIPPKIRLKGESSRIPVCIFQRYPESGRYNLICEWGF